MFEACGMVEIDNKLLGTVGEIRSSEKPQNFPPSAASAEVASCKTMEKIFPI